MYLVLQPADIFYLTGINVHEVGEVMMLVNNDEGIMMNEGIILCDPRTRDLFDAKKYAIIGEPEKWKDILLMHSPLITDPTCLTQDLRAKLEGWGVLLTMGMSPITHKRRVKTPEEIEKLRESQRINKAVFEAIQPYLQIGVSEREVTRRIQILQLELGGDGPSFPPIVAFGESTAVPHHSPTSRRLQENDVILIDMGVIYQGYCSDMTRCLFQKNT